MTTKFSYSLQGIRRLGNEKHVLLRADDCSQSLAEDRMILYAQDTDRLGLNRYRGPILAIVIVFESLSSLEGSCSWAAQ